MRFFGRKFPKKCLKMLFWPFFKNLSQNRRRKLGQNRVFILVWESSENQFGRTKKKFDKIFKNCFKVRPPPLEKFLDPLAWLIPIITLAPIIRREIYHGKEPNFASRYFVGTKIVIVFLFFLNGC